MYYVRCIIIISMFTSLCGGFITGKSALADSNDEIQCLAENIYFEARNQRTIGMLAVATVTMNRMESDDFPDTVCEVVKQGYHIGSHPIKNKCQFSWYCDGKLDRPEDSDSWFLAKAMAFKFYFGWFDKLDWVDDALYYHADYVKPDWASEKKHIIQIQNHIFYGELR